MAERHERECHREMLMSERNDGMSCENVKVECHLRNPMAECDERECHGGVPLMESNGGVSCHHVVAIRQGLGVMAECLDKIEYSNVDLR